MRQKEEQFCVWIAVCARLKKGRHSAGLIVEVLRKMLEGLGRPALCYWEEEWQPYYAEQLKWQEIEAQIKANLPPRVRQALGYE
jgi:hypothetical protein